MYLKGLVFKPGLFIQGVCIVYVQYKMSRVVRKLAFCICENKDADQLRGASAFVFATWIEQFLFYLNPKLQASVHLLWLYSLVCVRPGRKPRRPVFSERGSNTASLRGYGTYLKAPVKLHIGTTAFAAHTVYM